MPKKILVSASEIGEYTYCKRAWWLRFNKFGQTTPEMLLGTEGHNVLATQVHATKHHLYVGAILIGTGLIGLLLLSLYYVLR